MSVIADNLARVHEAVASAAAAAGRSPDEITLIAVSKTHPPAAIEAALAAGQRVFGESTVQEARGKLAHFAGRGLEWHFIGRLQSNKARFVPQNFAWLHSLDSARLAQRLSRFARDHGAGLDALIEVNLTGDPRKHGVAPAEVFGLIEQLRAAPMPGLALRGLMTIGPYPAAETESRRIFATLRRLRDDCRARFALPAFDELSMGMSGDYVEAIREGSTMIRVGTAIFGARDYTNN